MLNVLKVEGARSSVDKGEPQRGFRGRVEAFVERDPEDGFVFNCVDVGNYGTERHRVTAPLSLEQVRYMIADLTALLQGRNQSTQVEVENDVEESVEDEVVAVSLSEVEDGIASSVAPFAGSETQNF